MKKAMISIISAAAGAAAGVAAGAAGAAAIGKVRVEENEKIKSMSIKHFELFQMMNQWVKVKQEGKNLVSYFEANGYHKIAVYGMSYVGETLIDELRGTGIEIVYGIDKNAELIYSDIDVVSPEDELKSVDAVVVTAITFFDEIEKLLASKMDCPIVSLEDIVYKV